MIFFFISFSILGLHYKQTELLMNVFVMSYSTLVKKKKKNVHFDLNLMITKSLLLYFWLIITNKHKKPTSIFLTNIKLLFDLWPLIQFTIFEEEPCQIEEESCKCPAEEESIHFEEVYLRVCFVQSCWK